MKRYLAFTGHVYYPSGGMEDFVGDFDSITEAQEAIIKEITQYRLDPDWRYDWYHIYDAELKQIIEKDGFR